MQRKKFYRNLENYSGNNKKINWLENKVKGTFPKSGQEIIRWNILKIRNLEDRKWFNN